MAEARRRLGQDDLGWAAAFAVLLLVAHAIAYLLHEYAHSVTAWMLGWMRNPLALDYGSLTPGNLVTLAEVGDHVAYAPILAGGRGGAAATIALAGPFVGNGALYLLVEAFSRRRPPTGWGGALLFGLALMAAGNLWSYVPIRALASHADIAIAAQGLGVSNMALLPFVLVPTLAVAWHFLAIACPRRWVPRIGGRSAARQALVCASIGYWFFAFFGGAALSGDYGEVSQALSLGSVYLLTPIAIVALWRSTAVSPPPPR